jgi:hypothetical protein
MAGWIQSNARGSRAAHHYALEQFGLTEEGLREVFAFYCERMWPGR